MEQVPTGIKGHYKSIYFLGGTIHAFY